MSPETRSKVMSRIRGKDTAPERVLASLLEPRGILWEAQVRSLPGRPDFVFAEQKVAVFVDGDFWHGWRFPLWRHKLQEKWAAKIAANRERDRKNHRRLRRLGWTVIWIWEHQLKNAPEACRQRVLRALDTLYL
jgi:DNA mismatch endonuclease (patch repair protein)